MKKKKRTSCRSDWGLASHTTVKLHTRQEAQQKLNNLGGGCLLCPAELLAGFGAVGQLVVCAWVGWGLRGEEERRGVRRGGERKRLHAFESGLQRRYAVAADYFSGGKGKRNGQPFIRFWILALALADSDKGRQVYLLSLMLAVALATAALSLSLAAPSSFRHYSLSAHLSLLSPLLHRSWPEYCVRVWSRAGVTAMPPIILVHVIWRTNEGGGVGRGRWLQLV